MIKLFLSHSTKDWDVLRPIVEALEQRRFSVWHSERDVRSGDFQAKIASALETIDWVLVAASPNAIESEWVKSEVHIAFDLKPQCVLGLMVRECRTYCIHLHLPRRHFISLASHVDHAVDEIVAALDASFAQTDIRSVGRDTLREWGVDDSVADEAISLARNSTTLDGFARRVLRSHRDGLVQQMAFCLMSGLAPTMSHKSHDLTLLPPGTIEFRQSIRTLSRPVYLSTHPVATARGEITLDWASDWIRKWNDTHNLHMSLARLNTLVYAHFLGLVKGGVTRTPSDQFTAHPSHAYCEELCVASDASTGRRQGWEIRLDNLMDDAWSETFLPNPMARHAGATFRLECTDEL